MNKKMSMLYKQKSYHSSIFQNTRPYQITDFPDKPSGVLPRDRPLAHLNFHIVFPKKNQVHTLQTIRPPQE